MDNNELPEKEIIFEMLEVLAENGIPKPGTAGIIDVGTSDFLNFVDKELLGDFIPNGGATCRFFEGTYGSGKSHLLDLIEDIALKKGFIVCRIDLANDLSFENWSQIIKHILENCQILIGDNSIRNFPNILFELPHSECLKIEKLQKAQLPHPGFQNAILRALRTSCLGYATHENLYRFLLGEKVTAKAMKASGLKAIKNPLAVNNSEQVLVTILNAINLLGMKGCILLFDETDKSWNLHNRNIVPKRILVASNLIRRFIDSSSLGRIRGTLAVFAVLPNFIGDCKRCYPALGERLGFERVEDKESAWRWPILPISAVSSLYNTCESEITVRELFLRKIIEKFTSIVDYCEGKTTGIETELLEIGKKQLEDHAGKDYKRAIIKAFALNSIKHIDF
jgi:hypothetical protein